MSLCWTDRDTLRETGKRELILTITACLLAIAALSYDPSQSLFQGPLVGRTVTEDSAREDSTHEVPTLTFQTWRTS